METSKERMERWTKVIADNVISCGCMNIREPTDGERRTNIEAAVWSALTHLMEERHGKSKTDPTGA